MAYYPVDWEKSVRKECRRRRYSPKTSLTYVACIKRFLKYSKKTIDKISKRDVRLYLEYLSDQGKAGNTMNVYHMAIKFLFEDVLEKRMWIDISYSKVRKRLPDVLSQEEVQRIFQHIANKKHRLMAKLLYGSGLRVSELLSLRVENLHLDNGYGYVRNGKGGKDRIMVIPNALIEDLKIIVNKEGLTDESFLFTSNRNQQYSARSVQQIIKNAAGKAKIAKKVHPHTLRHSFATHLVENGYAVNDVQAVLGHKSPETSMIYVHNAQAKLITIKSPLDQQNKHFD